MSLPVSSRAQLQEIAATATAAAALANSNAASSGGKGVPLSQLMKPETEGSSKRSGKSPQRIATAKAPQAAAIKEEKNCATAGEEADELAVGRDRRGSYSSTSDRSSYTGSSSEGEDECYRKSPRLKAQRTSKGFTDFAIRDLELAEFGRREIEYAEQGWCHTKEAFWFNVDPFCLVPGMAGIMSLRESAKREKALPLKGARVIGCTHINSQTGVGTMQT